MNIPLGHRLLSEANSIKSSNSKNALLVAMSGLEVGVKECIVKLNPKSQWLVENMPSPNVLRMINEYIPLLLKHQEINNVLPLPKQLSDTIKKAVSIRNKIAHIGQSALKIKTEDEIYSTLYDVLWILDYCSGNDWALGHVSYRTKGLIREKQK